MKKTLIALAVLGTVGAAQAQSSVVVYGQLNPSYDYVTVKRFGAATSVKTTAMQYNASRIGFMGSEDLGGGLKANFKLETEFDLVNDAGFTASGNARDTYVGLSGNFGAVQFGNVNSVYKGVSAAYDPFEDTIGDYNSIMGRNGYNTSSADQRYKQTANYYSPVFSGFQVQANYGLIINQVDTNADTTAYSLAGVYNNGPLNAFAAYDHQNVSTGTDGSFWKVGAAYNFGQGTTVRGIYEKVKYATPTTSFSAAHWLLGAEHQIGAVTLMANYINAGDFDAVNTGASAYNLGVKYDLSKRTNITGIYSYLKNDQFAKYGDANAKYTTTAADGDKFTGFSVRLQHKF